jgi:hypothetical protein
MFQGGNLKCFKKEVLSEIYFGSRSKGPSLRCHDSEDAASNHGNLAKIGASMDRGG